MTGRVGAGLSRVCPLRCGHRRFVSYKGLWPEDASYNRPMRTVSVAALALLCSIRPVVSARPAAAPQLAIDVDPRVELVSIVFHLAGHPEYTGLPGPYRDAVDAWFGPFRDHPAVVHARELRARHGISYEAPAQLALYLDAQMRPIRKLDDDELPPGLERWKGVAVVDYVAELRDFARISDVARFRTREAPYYAAVSARYRRFFDGVPIVPFYGERFGTRPKSTHRLVPGLLTGPMNYGVRAVRTDGSEELVQILCLENVDAEGLPRPSELSLDLMVHETGHPYVNPLIDATEGRLEDVALPLFRRFEKTLRAHHYATVNIMLRESVVRALAVLWLRTNADAAHVARTLRVQEAEGFPWTAELADALARHRSMDADALVTSTHAVFAAWAARP